MPGLSRIVEIEVTSEMGKSFQVTTIFPSKTEIMQGIYSQQWTYRIACFYLPIFGRSSRSERGYQKDNSRN